MPPTHFSWRRETVKLSVLRPDHGVDRQQDAEHDRGVGRVGAGEQPAIEPDAETVPIISGHSRRKMSRRYGPPKVCQILVTIAGTMTIAIAWPGGIVTASRPIDTVGRPSPSTPLMNPAQEGRPRRG